MAIHDPIKLSDYDTTPLYNIKAVVQASEISPSTLRAWERRYHVCEPHRSESGYRLYSDRDLAVIRWLKRQVDSGMAISQAVNWLETLTDKAQRPEDVVLPWRGGQGRPPVGTPTESSMEIEQPLDFVTLQHELLDSLLHYEEDRAEMVLTEAFARYPVEQVGEMLLTPVLTEIGRRWHAGKLNITVEHYATSYLRQRLSVLLRAAPVVKGGPMVWAGCAPGELHEIACQMITIYLRRAGVAVQYLGQNVHTGDLIVEMGQRKPRMVILSANSEQTAATLADCSRQVAQMQEANRPLFGYGGMIFNQKPHLRAEVTGIYLGATTKEAVEVVRQMLYN